MAGSAGMACLVQLLGDEEDQKHPEDEVGEAGSDGLDDEDYAGKDAGIGGPLQKFGIRIHFRHVWRLLVT